ncbi:MAG TPA: hypothetical protein VFW95_03520 [Candidatus Limnocylindria bacterium]|nr:hypothetical protein [Candidatus Limnocylindria bacterium]
MGAHDPAAWGEFGLALVGAAAALAGLLFVAISINLHEILSGPGLTGRAGEAVLVLIFVLVTTALLLVPGQGPRALGIEWLTATAILFCVLVAIHRRPMRPMGHSGVSSPSRGWSAISSWCCSSQSLGWRR